MRAVSVSTLCLFLSFQLSKGSVACPNGFSVLNNNKCVRLFTNEFKHRQAETDCRYLGGTLVNIKNAIDNRGISNLAAMAGVNSVWIGAFCFDGDHSTDCFYDDQSGMLNYINFAAGFPLINDNYGGCVYMATTGQNVGQWYSAKCDVVGMPFVCEVPLTYYDSSYCTHNYNGNCYYPSTELGLTTINTTYSRAQSICQSKNMNLASVHSMRELDYIKFLYRQSKASSILLGASAFLPDTFIWADNSNWNFTYMNPTSTSEGDCLQMDLTSGFWTEVDCQTAEYFLCKRPVIDTSTNPTTTTLSTPSPMENVINLVDGPDFSHCNTTLFMAPGVVTSFGYPAAYMPRNTCSYNLVTTGAYNLGIFFTDLATYNGVLIFDEFGKVIGNPRNGQFNVTAPTNIATMTFTAMGFTGYHGFRAVVLPV